MTIFKKKKNQIMPWNYINECILKANVGWKGQPTSAFSRKIPACQSLL